MNNAPCTQINVFDILKNDDDFHIILDDDTRAKLRKAIFEKFGSIKNFSYSCGFKTDTLLNWVRLDKKRRQPTYKTAIFLGNKLGTALPTKTSKFRINNSTVAYSQLSRLIQLDVDFAIGLGIFLAEGQKNTKKKFTISNTNKLIIKYMIDWLMKYFGTNKDELYFYIYSPNKNFDREKLSKKYSSIYAIQKDKIKIYPNKRSSQECTILVAHNKIIKRVIDKIITIQNLMDNKNFSLDLVGGTVLGDGCVSFDKRRKYYEISIACGDYEINLIKNALTNIGIEFKENSRKNKTKGKTYFLDIHKKKNFEKIVKTKAFDLDENKKQILEAAIANYVIEN